MAEHAAAVRRNDVGSQVAAHSTGSGHKFKFDQAEILARSDNCVRRELLESWFTGPQSIDKCNDLPIQYTVLRLRLGGVIGYAGSAQVILLPAPGSARQMVEQSSHQHPTHVMKLQQITARISAITPRATIPDEREGAVNIHRQDNEVVVGPEFLKCIALDLGKHVGRPMSHEEGEHLESNEVLGFICRSGVAED
nr:unnamed protein product [Spirometra erinaceieuropaei]